MLVRFLMLSELRTGETGTRGIGRGIAECLARDGFQLVLGYNSNLQRAQTTCTELTEKYHVRARHVSGDIADSRTVENLFEAAQVRHLGP